MSKHKDFNRAQVAAAAEARDRAAAGNPQAVRQAFIGGGPIQLGELTIQPLTIGTFWLLEELQSPFVTASKVAAGAEPVATPIGFKDIAEAAFILAEPLRARELLSQGRNVFIAAAFEIAAKVPIGDMQKLSDAISGRVGDAEKVTPPPGKSDKENPTESPARAQGSAGG
jgi:hypothetical protein